LAEADQYFARLVLDEVVVKLSTVESHVDGDTHECVGTGPCLHFDQVPCGSVVVSAVASELRLLNELELRRNARAGPIVRHLERVGCDKELIRRGLNRLGADEPMEQFVAPTISKVHDLSPGPARVGQWVPESAGSATDRTGEALE
jgi:hypothetical protein